MNYTGIGVLETVSTFRKLHEEGCFIMPNPWDAGSAVYLKHLGFKALATTSAGLAFTMGLPDEIDLLPKDTVLKNISEIVAATDLPVNADFQNCYADEPSGVAENVKLCLNTGVAGLSIEDACGENGLLYERNLAIERVKAARKAVDESGIPAVLTARCEAFLVGVEEPFKIVLDRLEAYAQAGADCLYAPGISDPEQIESIVKLVAPKPVNVLISSNIPGLSAARLQELGVRRISVGSGLARVAWKAFIRSAEKLAHDGSFEAFSDIANFQELNNVFSARLKA